MASNADDALAKQLRQLRREYLDESSRRVDELRQLSARLAGGDSSSLPELRQAFHRLAGSGGSYGFPHVSTHAREAELVCQKVLAAGTPTAPSDLQAIGRDIDAIAAAFVEAAESLRRDSPQT